MYRILIIDDEPIILQGLSEAIKDSELPFLNVDTSNDPVQALRMYEAAPYDIILSDISMPQMDGLDMVSEMKKIWPGTAVLFLTGYQSFDYARRALKLQSIDYLLKPISDEELISHLEGVIKKLDAGWLEQFLYENQAPAMEKENKRIGESLKKIGCFAEEDEDKLQELPFDEERKLRILTIRSSLEDTRLLKEPFFDWMLRILQQTAYGYGIVYGYMEDDCCTFLIQKTGNSEKKFSGILHALEQMQEYFYIHRQIQMTIWISHQTDWKSWCSLAEGQKQTVRELPFGSFGQDQLTLASPVMMLIEDYIRKNPGADLSLGELSRQFRINSSYLSRSFHQTFGKQISAFITEIRMAEAARLLKETDRKIYEIGSALGYDTQNYFTKVFSKYNGCTPKEYRMRQQTETRQ